MTEQAYRMGVAPDALARQLTDGNQLGAVAADVLRGNALSWLAQNARIVDEAGRPVYVGGRRGGRCGRGGRGGNADETADAAETEDGADEGTTDAGADED